MACQAVVYDDCVAFALRPTVGRYFYCRICVGSMQVDDLTVSEYLRFKEKLASTMATLSSSVLASFLSCFLHARPTLRRNLTAVMHALFKNVCCMRTVTLSL